MTDKEYRWFRDARGYFIVKPSEIRSGESEKQSAHRQIAEYWEKKT